MILAVVSDFEWDLSWRDAKIADMRKHSYVIFSFFSICGVCQMTALHVAVEKAHIEIVEYLSDKATDINIQDKEGVSKSISM